MNTEYQSTELPNAEFPNPLDLSDEQLRIARDAARWRADRLLRKSKRAAPHEWSELAQASNRAVAEFLALDAELAARHRIRWNELLSDFEETKTSGADPLPDWLAIVCGLAGAVALAALWVFKS